MQLDPYAQGQSILDGVAYETYYDAKQNRDYYLGNVPFVGKVPDPGQDNYEDLLDLVERGYNGTNLIKYIADMWAIALVGQQFSYTFTDENTGEGLEADSKEIKTAKKYLSRWMNWQQKIAVAQDFNNNDVILEAVTRALVTGESYLLFHNLKTYQNSPHAWKHFSIQCPAEGSIQEVKRNSDRFINYFEYHREVDGKEVVDVFFIDENGKTVYQIEGEDEQRFDMEGRLPLIQITAPPIISRDMCRKQAQLYKNNLIIAGQGDSPFRERVFTGSLPLGRWVLDKEKNRIEFIPDEEGLQSGEDVTNFVMPVPVGDPNAPTNYAKQDLHIIDPPHPEAAIMRARFYRSSILQDGRLTWTELMAQGETSEVSRMIQKSEFEKALKQYAKLIGASMGCICDLALWMMGEIAAIPFLKELETNVQLVINTGKPLPAQRIENRNDQHAGLMSRRRAIHESGCDDVDSELAEIQADLDSNLELQRREMELARALAQPSMAQQAEMEEL